MEFTISTFVWTIINFIVLLGILSYFLFKPVNLVIDRRNSEIENDINQAKTDKEKAKELRIANEKEYKAAKKEGKTRSEEHTSELQSRQYLVCRLLLEKQKQNPPPPT